MLTPDLETQFDALMPCIKTIQLVVSLLRRGWSIKSVAAHLHMTEAELLAVADAFMDFQSRMSELLKT
jgi:hypothetical protein